MDMTTVFWLTTIVLGLVCGFLSGDIADKKGYGGALYFCLGLFFSLIGLLYAIGLPETLENKRASAVDAGSAADEARARRIAEMEAEKEYTRKEQERAAVKVAPEVGDARSALIHEAKERRIKSGTRVICRKCGGLMEVYDDNTCVMCGSKLLPD